MYKELSPLFNLITKRYPAYKVCVGHYIKNFGDEYEYFTICISNPKYNNTTIGANLVHNPDIESLEELYNKIDIQLKWYEDRDKTPLQIERESFNITIPKELSENERKAIAMEKIMKQVFKWSKK